MNEENNSQQVAPLTLGQRLIEAREAKGLTLADASNQLRFSVRQLGMLEQEQFEQLGSPYAVRGMLRAYAKYLSLSEEIMVSLLESVLPAAKKQTFDTQAVAVQPKNIHFSMSASDGNKLYLRYFLLAILLIVLVTLVVWFEKFSPRHHLMTQSTSMGQDPSGKTNDMPNNNAIVIVDKPNAGVVEQIKPMEAGKAMDATSSSSSVPLAQPNVTPTTNTR